MAREPKKQPGRVNWRLTFGILVVGAIAVSTAMAGYKASLYVQLKDPKDRKATTKEMKARLSKLFLGS